ncbi:bifunctional indole-3-glycerol-phosphate synthase TrpC/phosphoribosylanthranilate isomerase TrpF [Aliikangiella sp. IMCC44359]|uniref:bifunctional indole-3-glycerol-phosphate synthase TrpC/phosphoribosylanthranilate isomerase TrpF n=1 Tax=Aliikangiella sp. IMCC44359 TaxID=3459125 RepID=UPI00403A8F2D
MKNVLQEIVAHKRDELVLRKKQKPLESFQGDLTKSTRSLEKALSNQYADFILECKKASPSKGLIREDFNLDYILEQYKDYASAISVLTDHKYFQGDFSFLSKASKIVNVPILCKDFFIDIYQVYEARHYGADAILLMLSVLNDDDYIKLAKIAESLDLDILTEVHDEQELNRAIHLNAKIIGINNRNLKDLSIDLATTEKLASKIPAGRIAISESGIESHSDIKRLSPLVNGFLVGSSIMAQQDIRMHCKSLIFGKVKICGITREQDAKSVDQYGGIYAGFIFYPKSKRYISLESALKITNSVKLQYVGVFVDEEISLIVDYAKQLNLYAVQLHGDESAEYIQALKTALPNIQLWKAQRITNSINFTPDNHIDRYLLDTYSDKEQGGTGHHFDWELLKTVNTDNIILAGGINLDNINKANSFNTFALDLSSGVESKPGIKDTQKIAEIFEQLRA